MRALPLPSGQSQTRADLPDGDTMLKEGVKKFAREGFMEILILDRAEYVREISMDDAGGGGGSLAHDGPLAKNAQGLIGGRKKFNERMIFINILIIVGI